LLRYGIVGSYRSGVGRGPSRLVLTVRDEYRCGRGPVGLTVMFLRISLRLYLQQADLQTRAESLERQHAARRRDLLQAVEDTFRQALRAVVLPSTLDIGELDETGVLIIHYVEQCAHRVDEVLRQPVYGRCLYLCHIYLFPPGFNFEITRYLPGNGRNIINGT